MSNADEKPSGTREARDPIAKTPDEIIENDLANQKMGDNELAGNGQYSVQNQRHDQAGSRQDTDGVIESAEKLDKDVRAERDLGKGG